MDVELKDMIKKEWARWDENLLPEEYAMLRDLAGIQMFEKPIWGVASASDPLFTEMKKPGVIGPHHLTPTEWLPTARVVISLFFPFTEEVKLSNLENPTHASSLWQHARVDGEQAIRAFKHRLSLQLRENGFDAIVPSEDDRYLTTDPISSSWSERHAAFAAGLGTFGMSRGLITEKGIAGRFASVITSADLTVTVRNYSQVYEYCIRCGACAERCPANAIDPDLPMDEAKDQWKCKNYLDILKEISKKGEDTRPPEEQSDYFPEKRKEYFGCGKCQVGVPCESANPSKIMSDDYRP